jgi:glycosyltransferase involved in cell wall biosynthesis
VVRIALLTERAHAVPRCAEDWCDRLVAGLAEHEFERYVLVCGPSGAAPPGPGVRELALRGPRPSGRAPGPVRRRQYAAAYEQLIRALVLPGERAGFAAGLHRLAELARQDRGLPGFLVSGRAHQVLERVWRSPGAETAAGQPLVHDVLVAGELLEQCLRPLCADWYGDGVGGLGAADLCHVVGGGPAVLPALLAKEVYGVPFVVTEHGVRLRELYACCRRAPYRWPVRALLLGFLRQLTAEGYRQAALLTPGSGYDREWQLACGADPARIRVVPPDVPRPARQSAGPGGAPALVWAGPLAPEADPELMLRAFARVRAEVPGARLLLHGPEGQPGYRAHCAAVAERLGLAVGPEREVRFDDGAAPWERGTVAVFSHRSLPAPGPLAEAMLSGRAVIATDVGVAREVLGPAGLLVPPGEPAALAAACRALLADRERRERLGRAGRQRAAERFAAEPSVAAFREAYLELVSRWPALAAAERAPGALPRPFARPAEYWVTGAAAGRAAVVRAS